MYSRHQRRITAFVLMSLVGMTTIAQPTNSSTNCTADGVDTSSLYDAPTKQNVFFIPSSSFIADRTFMAMSAMNGPSSSAKVLAWWMTIAADCPLQLTVAGKNESKTLRVIKDAFDLIGDRDLHGLDFTLVGDGGVVYIWVEDGETSLNVDLVSAGIFPGVVMADMVDNYDGLTEELQKPEFAAVKEQVAKERAEAPQDRPQRLISEDQYKAAQHIGMTASKQSLAACGRCAVVCDRQAINMLTLRRLLLAAN